MKTIIRIGLGLLLLTQMSLIGLAQSGGVIRTVAGNGIGGYSGDGGPAASAQLNQPQGVAVDSAGNLYIADSGNHRIRKVTPDGMISTVAGNGTGGFGGDGGPAILAQLFYPMGVTLDAAGNLYIADWFNSLVRKVAPDGMISTVAEGGWLMCVIDVAVDQVGNLYFSESVFIDGPPDRVRKVTPDGVISTVAGGGTQPPDDGRLATDVDLYPVGGIELDSSGNLYIASFDRVHKVTPDGVLRTVAGGGTQYPGDGVPATSADLGAVDIAIDSAGNLYIGDIQSKCILKVTPEGVISTVAGNGTSGFGGDGGPATLAQLNDPIGVALDSSGSLYIADTGNHRIRKVDFRKMSINLNVSLGGAATADTVASTGPVQSGYAVVTTESGALPYGTAVFSVTQNGVVVSEAGVPASPPTTSARIFIDYRSHFSAKFDGHNVGTIDINTGFAIVNPGTGTASITYQLNDRNGNNLATGHGTLPAQAHKALFITELNQVAPDFVLPSDFPAFEGSLNISSDQPLSVVGLRVTTNQRGETLLTTTPVADLTKSPGTGPLFFPQLVDGGGFTTSIFLMNTSDTIETGRLDIFTNSGEPLAVRQLGDEDSYPSYTYFIIPGGYDTLITDGSPSVIKAGAVRITPDAGTNTPAGAGVFSYSPGGILVTESGIPSATPTTHARIYVDQSNGHNSGLAVAAPGGTPVGFILNAYRSDGVTFVGSGSLNIAGNGHDAKFANQLIPSLPSDFTGVLDISSSSPFVALTLRSLTNSRGDFLMTTFPIADFNQPAPFPIVFPQIADGGGYKTQFILLSTSGEANTNLSFFGDNGAPLAVGKMAGGNR